MAEYITPDEICRMLERFKESYPGKYFMPDTFAYFMSKFTKTRDIVAVIRCKNCIHHHTFACRTINPADDDFCKYGESMENL